MPDCSAVPAHLCLNAVSNVEAAPSQEQNMSIPTQMSLVGFVASAPELHFTKKGDECCRLRVGVEQWRKEVDGSFTKLDPTFHELVAFESTARETYARFRPGDSFVASGYIHEFEVERRDEPSVIKEEFVARKIGHNVNRTEYVVQRGRHAADRPPTAVPQSPAVSL
jgi:single-strand DNA-binding protein